MTKYIPVDEFGFRAKAVASAKEAISHLQLPKSSDVMLIGSCAEGFSDPMSDIDIVVVIPPAGNREPTFRHYTWVGQQRVEIYSRSTDFLADFVDRINGIKPGSIAKSISDLKPFEDMLDEDLKMYHRIMFAFPIIDSGVMNAIHGRMDHDILITLRAELEWARFRDFSQLSRAAAELDVNGLANDFAQRALEAAGAAWSTLQGQTYGTRKFLSWRLSRAGLAHEHVALFERLSVGKHDVLLPNSLDFQALTEIFGAPVVTEQASFKLRDDAVQVRLANQIWIGDRQCTIVLPETFLGAFAAPMGAGIARVPEALEVRKLCLLAGLAFLETSGGRTERLDQILDSKRKCILTANGFSGLAMDPIVVRESIHALVDAGLAIVMAGFMFSNYKEDALGAAKTGRWFQFETALAQMRRSAMDAIALSETFRAAPSEPSAAHLLPASTVAELVEQADTSARIRCQDAASALQALSQAEVIFARLAPEILGLLHSSMANAISGMAFIELVLVWGKAARGMGKTLAMAETLENEWEAILDQFGSFETAQEMRVHVKPEMMPFAWARPDDLRLVLLESQ